MNFERGVIRFAQYVFALMIVMAITIYLGAFPTKEDMAVALLIGLVLAAWESR